MARVLIPLAQGCEELEAVTCIDLLRRAGIEVVTAGLDAEPVTASRGTRLLPDRSLDEVAGEDFDLILLPGGQPGTNNLDADPRIRALLQKQAGAGKPLAAVCAAPKILANAGLLAGRQATAYPGTLENLHHTDISITGQAITRDGNIITSRGPGTAMDFALTVIETLTDKTTRDKVEAALVR